MDTHPVLAATSLIDQALKSVADVNPTFMDTTDKAAALSELVRLESRVAELRLRILTDADDLAVESASRDAAAWLAHHTHTRGADARADLRLGQALDRRYAGLAVAMREGRVNHAQAQVIARALDALPDEIPADTVASAEEALVGYAADFGPRPLARLGARILEVVAPDLADQAEGRRLAALEENAARATRLTMRRLGDGTTRLSAIIPDATASRLATYLDAFTNPRQTKTPDGDPVARLPHPRKLGDAFCQLLEAVDPARLPLHAGDATTIVITIPLHTLRAELGTGDLLAGATIPGPDTGDGLSAGQVRRLACTAHLIPAVLGSTSEVLDLGRSQRLFSRKQRKALLVRDRTCRAEGCDIPGTWCEAHHWHPWTTGGNTDLNDGLLLCSHHHHRAHETTHRAERLPSGDVRFHRRT